MASVSAPSRAKCTMMDTAVPVLVTKWSMMVNACALTAPAVTMLWSTAIQFVYASLITPCARVWQFALTMMPTAPKKPLNISAPSTLHTASGSVLNLTASNSLTSWIMLADFF